MFLVEINIKETELNKLTETEATMMLEQHRKWFKNYAEKGTFLVVGPFKNSGMSGMIISKNDNIELLQAIISEDVYYPNLAEYSIREFSANIISDKLKNYKGE